MFSFNPCIPNRFQRKVEITLIFRIFNFSLPSRFYTIMTISDY